MPNNHAELEGSGIAKYLNELQSRDRKVNKLPHHPLRGQAQFRLLLLNVPIHRGLGGLSSSQRDEESGDADTSLRFSRILLGKPIRKYPATLPTISNAMVRIFGSCC